MINLPGSFAGSAKIGKDDIIARQPHMRKPTHQAPIHPFLLGIKPNLYKTKLIYILIIKYMVITVEKINNGGSQQS